MKKFIVMAIIIAACTFVIYYIQSIKKEDIPMAQDLNTQTETQNNEESRQSGRMINIRPQLIGKWQSDDDSKNIIEFTLTEKIDTYDNQKSSHSLYELNPSPDDAEWVISTKEDDIDMSYRIIAVSDTKLELEYLGRGNILIFNKIVK